MKVCQAIIIRIAGVCVNCSPSLKSELAISNKVGDIYQSAIPLPEMHLTALFLMTRHTKSIHEKESGYSFNEISYSR